MKSLVLVLFALACSFSSLVSATILPPNNFAIFDDPNRIANITEQQFNEVSDHIIAMWQPIAELHGAKLVVNKRWNDSTVNAYAQQSGNVWSVTMFGGLARRPEVTLDAFALVVCHELGHHFGGHYFYERDSWAAAEGQADYFATHVCGHRVFERARTWNLRYRTGVPKTVEDNCNAVYKEKAAQEVCYRQAAGGLSLATLLAVIGGSASNLPKFETPDQRKAPKTNTAHPQAQCRLDTYFQGALCAASFDLKVIPGKDLGPGNNNTAKAEAIASTYSCFQHKGFQLGNRPACWFKPQAQLY